MATTTNYGWTTPDDTALVKDGAAAIRTLGSSVDTTTKALNPSTTLGDIEYRSSTANTNTRLGIGTTGQVLTVSGGVPTWATSPSGSMALLSTTSLSGNAVDITGISTSYKDLRILIKDVTFNSNEAGLRMRFNNASGANTYQTVYYAGYEGGLGALAAVSDTSFLPYRTSPYFSSADAFFVITIADYANTATYKTVSSLASWTETGFSAGEQKMISVSNGGWFATPAAISQINLFMTASKTFSTGTVEIYGVN